MILVPEEITLIAQVSDLHLDDKKSAEMGIDTRANFLKVLENIKERTVAEIVFTGDLAEKTAVGWFFETLEKSGLRYSCVPGNHDDITNFPAIGAGSGEDEYYYARGIEAHTLIFLDTGRASVSSSQLAWMKKQIDETDKDPVLFMHHPVIDCGNTYMDAAYPLKNRDAVYQVLRETGRDITIFCGHYHFIDYRRADNIRQYTAPSVYYQIKKIGGKLETEDLPIGYRLIKIDGGISAEIINVI
ncbi:MAG: hypothetical protein E4H36_15725 [Spirochaetales bacterium]|nr:MAG: hypothetical protein E4H36_15725 [Spirochaetales bacterium]